MHYYGYMQWIKTIHYKEKLKYQAPYISMILALSTSMHRAENQMNLHSREHRIFSSRAYVSHL